MEQETARQTEIMKKFDIDKTFIEKVSAKDTNRRQLQELLEFVREGDTVYIVDFSRLARNVKDLLDERAIILERQRERYCYCQEKGYL